MSRVHIGVIGGGASGMTAAIIAKREGALVTILEGLDMLGKKILSTGNGRCNLGNLCMDDSFYYAGDKEKLHQILSQFDTADTIRFFRSLGLFVKEKEGYLYPYSEQATAVLDVLRYEVEVLEIPVIYSFKATSIEKTEQGFVVSNGQKQYTFDKVIIATGGKSTPVAGSDGSGYVLAKQMGHTIIKPVPGLVALRCKEDFFQKIAGVRAIAEVSSNGLKEFGEVQFTDQGISGIPVFQISREIAYRLKVEHELTVTIDFFPNMSVEELSTALETRMLLQKGRTAEQFFTGMLNSKIMSLLLELCELQKECFVSEEMLDQLIHVLALAKCFPVTVHGTNAFEQSQVTAGGVDLTEVTQQLESTKEKGLYFTGEILDVDGKCGGYNLHFAWATGTIAGMHATRG